MPRASCSARPALPSSPSRRSRWRSAPRRPSTASSTASSSSRCRSERLSSSCGSSRLGRDGKPFPLSPADYLDYTSQTTSFSGLAQFGVGSANFSSTSGGEPSRLDRAKSGRVLRCAGCSAGARSLLCAERRRPGLGQRRRDLRQTLAHSLCRKSQRPRYIDHARRATVHRHRRCVEHGELSAACRRLDSACDRGLDRSERARSPSVLCRRATQERRDGGPCARRRLDAREAARRAVPEFRSGIRRHGESAAGADGRQPPHDALLDPRRRRVSSCSSPARTSPICCSCARRRAREKWRCEPRSARRVDASFVSC